MEKETLEEFIESQPYYGTCTTEYKEGIEVGAKWQAERMYTYDEMRTIAYNAYCLGQLDSPTEAKFNLWIQQFKKK
jgi:hypothetical protein